MEKDRGSQLISDRKSIMSGIFETQGSSFTEVALSPLTVKALAEFHVPLVDALICFLFPRLEYQDLLGALANYHADLDNQGLRFP